MLMRLVVEQTLGQHQQDNANTYLGVRELLRDDRSREEEELDRIYEVYIHISNVPTLLIRDL